MCRHLAYLGKPVTLQSLIIDPPHGLRVQAWAPRRQRHGTINADGFGVGWYAEGDPAPARYRRAAPIWADPSFADVARVTRSRAVLAAVRSATEGTEPGAAAAAPYEAKDNGRNQIRVLSCELAGTEVPARRGPGSAAAAPQ